MKKVILAALLAVAASAQADVYHFSMSNGSDTISGSFEGTANGNIISNLTNISASMNGVALPGSGSLFSAQYVQNQYYWAPGAVASFDGKQNNFLFINSDYLNGDYSFTGYAYSLSWYGQSFATNYSDNFRYVTMSGSPANYNWTVTDVSAVPEPGSIALLGLGIGGLALARRRKA